MTHPGEELFVVPLCSIVLWVLVLPAVHVNGLPYGPHPPEAESGFSFKNFKEFVLAGITPETHTHTHDPSEMYLNKGQEPAVAQVDVAIPTQGQKLLFEKEGDNQGVADSTYNDDNQPATVEEKGETIQGEQPQLKPMEEALETLDVPHEHPKMEFSDVIRNEKLVVGDQTMDELPAAKVMAVREEI